MIKRAYFATFDGPGWPTLDFLRPYFFAPPGKQWFKTGGNDTAGLALEGVDGTGHLESGFGRVDVRLEMWGNPKLGVLLIWSKLGARGGVAYSSIGDLNRLNEHVRTLHNDPMPIGLYIPFEQAWKAVQEFIVTDGKLPTSIEWINNKDLPPNSFPTP